MRKQLLIASSIAITVAFAFAANRLFFNPPIRLAKETTHITSPLAEDGLPNYVQAILDKEKDGVTQENNGARQFWQAVGLGRRNPEHFEAICKELEIEFDSSRQPLVNVNDDEIVARLADWVANHNGSSTEGESDQTEAFTKNQAKAYIEATQSRPWASQELPPLAQWILENDAALNLLVEASKKDRFFSPPPNALLDPQIPVLDMMLPHAQAAREAICSLRVRGMHRLAAGEFEQAWNDILAVWRFGELIGRGPTSIERIVGVAIRSKALTATLAILDSPALPLDVAHKILNDLGTLEPHIELVSSLNFTDRALLLDFTSRLLTGRLGGVDDSDVESQIGLALMINPNIPLEMTNELFDRISTTVALDDWQARDEEIAAIHADLETTSRQPAPSIYALLSGRTEHSAHVGNILLALLMPAIDTPISATERDQTELSMAQIAAALAIYRIGRHAYPETLQELAESRILSDIPLDPYTGSPFHYERRNAGYLLYSLGKNRVDDGGYDFRRPIVDGEWIEESESVETTLDGGDVVIRLPLPSLELPFDPKPTKSTPE